MEKTITITHREEVSKLRIFIEYLVLALFLLFLIPIGVLLVTKDAIPGDSLYPYKIQIEISALALTHGTQFEETLNKIITGRRLQEREAIKKLDKNGR